MPYVTRQCRARPGPGVLAPTGGGAVADVAFVALTVVVFALLALVVRGAEKL